MAAVIVAQQIENNRMKAVLIGQTIDRLNRDFERARRLEEENVDQLKSSLDDTLRQLAEIDVLGEHERALIASAQTLVENIVNASRSSGVTF